MELNYIAIIVAGLVPMLLGYLWYNVLFKKPWMESLGFTQADIEGGNMAVIMGVSVLTSIILALGLKANIELTHKDVSDAGELIYTSFHTFKHGALHGLMTGVLLGVPALISNSLFQRNTGKNILLNVGYWLLTFAVMGGILDMWN